MILFNGKEKSQDLDNIIRSSLQARPVNRKLGIVIVGKDLPSIKFVNIKKKLCEGFGIEVALLSLNGELSDNEIIKMVSDFCADDKIGGVVIQLPLPRPSLNRLLELIPAEKDVDCISPTSLKKFYSNDFSKLSPVVRAFNSFLKFSGLELLNLDTTVIGKGFLVGEPLGHYILQQGGKVQFILDYKAGDPINCHLLLLSAGQPELVRGECLVEGCNVVDFGSSVVNDHTIGDFDLKSAMGHLGAVSPSPGGMGPIVTRYLIMNFLGI